MELLVCPSYGVETLSLSTISQAVGLKTKNLARCLRGAEDFSLSEVTLVRGCKVNKTLDLLNFANFSRDQHIVVVGVVDDDVVVDNDNDDDDNGDDDVAMVV